MFWRHHADWGEFLHEYFAWLASDHHQYYGVGGTGVPSADPAANLVEQEHASDEQWDEMTLEPDTNAADGVWGEGNQDDMQVGSSLPRLSARDMELARQITRMVVTEMWHLLRLAGVIPENSPGLAPWHVTPYTRQESRHRDAGFTIRDTWELILQSQRATGRPIDQADTRLYGLLLGTLGDGQRGEVLPGIGQTSDDHFHAGTTVAETSWVNLL